MAPAMMFKVWRRWFLAALGSWAGSVAEVGAAATAAEADRPGSMGVVVAPAYLRVDVIDELLASRINGEEQYQFLNREYSVYATTDPSGIPTERYRYTPFGVRKIDHVSRKPISSASIPFGFTGRYHDGLDLIYFRARLLEPFLGRFIGRDRKGYVNGLSLYNAYFVPNAVDPSGDASSPPNTTPQACTGLCAIRGTVDLDAFHYTPYSISCPQGCHCRIMYSPTADPAKFQWPGGLGNHPQLTDPDSSWGWVTPNTGGKGPGLFYAVCTCGDLLGLGSLDFPRGPPQAKVPKVIPNPQPPKPKPNQPPPPGPHFDPSQL